jgi:hypothetical protein
MGFDKQRIVYNHIKTICNKICNFTLRDRNGNLGVGGEVGYIAQAIKYPIWLRNLIQYSDLYSWGACLIVQSMAASNANQKQMLHNAGEICLINYFQRLKPTTGGRSKKLKKGGNGNGPTAVLPTPLYHLPSFEPHSQAMSAQPPTFIYDLPQGYLKDTTSDSSSIILSPEELNGINNTRYQIQDFAELVKKIAQHESTDDAFKEGLASNATNQTVHDNFYKSLAQQHFTEITPVEGPEPLKITLPQ